MPVFILLAFFMNKRYLTNTTFAAAIRHIERAYQTTCIRGPHWADWYIDNVKIASSCVSPHPGPDYGSVYWVIEDLVKGVEVVVRRSRPINRSEAHIINERLDYERRYRRSQPREQHVQLIPEVESAYASIRQNGGFSNRVEAGSFSIYWNECVVIN